MRTEIQTKFGSLSAFARAAGANYQKVRFTLLDSEKGDQKANKRLLGWLAIAEGKGKHDRSLLRLEFKNSMQGNYKQLLRLVQRDLPDIQLPRLRHYLNGTKSINQNCPTYKAVTRAITDSKNGKA